MTFSRQIRLIITIVFIGFSMLEILFLRTFIFSDNNNFFLNFEFTYFRIKARGGNLFQSLFVFASKGDFLLRALINFISFLEQLPNLSKINLAIFQKGSELANDSVSCQN